MSAQTIRSRFSRIPALRWLLLATGLVASSSCVAVATIDVVSSNGMPNAGGAAFSYTLTITNDASPATNVVVTDPLPPGIVLLNLSVAGAQGGSFSCSGPAVGANGTVVCTAASLAAAATATVVLTVQAQADLSGGTRTNAVRVVSGGVANTDSIAVTVVNNASLNLMALEPIQVASGDKITYRFNVGASGNASAVNAIFTTALPADTTFVSMSGANGFADGCSFDPTNRTLTCRAPFLPTGAHDINLTVRTAAGLLDGTAISGSATLTAAVGPVAGSPANYSTTIAN